MADLLLTEQPPKPARRGFLRTLITAPVAALATHRLLVPPPPAIIAANDAADRLRHHMAGVEAAMQDLFPGARVEAKGNCLDGHHDYYAEAFAQGERGTWACAIVTAGLPLAT